MKRVPDHRFLYDRDGGFLVPRGHSGSRPRATDRAIDGDPGGLVKPAASFRGLLELDGPIDFQYSARLVGAGAAALGVDLPIISSQSLGSANDKLVVQGLRSGGTRSADLTIVNLGKQAANCSVVATAVTATAGPVTRCTMTNSSSSVG